MTSAVLSEAALLWSVYVHSVAAVSPTKYHSKFVRLPGLRLSLFCLSLHVLVLVFVFSLHCLAITLHHTVFLLSHEVSFS